MEIPAFFCQYEQERVKVVDGGFTPRSVRAGTRSQDFEEAMKNVSNTR